MRLRTQMVLVGVQRRGRVSGLVSRRGGMGWRVIHPCGVGGDDQGSCAKTGASSDREVTSGGPQSANGGEAWRRARGCLARRRSRVRQRACD